MSTERAPAFQFYPRDFLSDVRVLVMDCAARGAYITLLSVCWLEGSLPTDERAICRLAGSHHNEWKRIREEVLSCFFERDGRYYQKRLEIERSRQQEFKDRQSNAGRRSAERRFNRGSTAVQPGRQPSVNRNPSLLSSSSSSVRTEPPTPLSTVVDSGFEEWYSGYPRKIGPKKARAAWKKRKLTAADLPRMLENLFCWKQTAQWQDPEKIPHPTTFLNREDDLASPSPAAVSIRPPVPSPRALGPSYASQDWFSDCAHEPKCETGPMHTMRRAIDKTKLDNQREELF